MTYALPWGQAMGELPVNKSSIFLSYYVGKDMISVLDYIQTFCLPLSKSPIKQFFRNFDKEITVQNMTVYPWLHTSLLPKKKYLP